MPENAEEHENIFECALKETDVVAYKTWDGRCSRCRREIREEEVPLHLWDEKDHNIMWTFCEDCSPEVMGVFGAKTCKE